MARSLTLFPLFPNLSMLSLFLTLPRLWIPTPLSPSLSPISRLSRALESVTHSLPVSPLRAPSSDCRAAAAPRRVAVLLLPERLLLCAESVLALDCVALRWVRDWGGCVWEWPLGRLCSTLCRGWSFFLPPKKLRRAPRPARTGWTTDASVVSCDAIAATLVTGVGSETGVDCQARAVEGVSCGGWGTVKSSISGANVLS